MYREYNSTYRDTNKKVSKSKIFAIVSTVVFIVSTFVTIQQSVFSKYNFEKKYMQYWKLAEKSSTILAKETHIVNFVEALKSGKTNSDFSSHNAIFLKTPNNSFDSNLIAVETLAQRLKEIQKMDPKSFEYNTAIQQITSQEQGEAHELLNVFYGCYTLENYIFIWGWIGGIVGITILVSLLSACISLIIYFESN